jgi:hypothetical protein
LDRFRDKEITMTSRLALVLVMVGLMVLTCGPADTPPSPTEQPIAPLVKSPCGDGLCDEVEQKDPTLCPQDCPPPELSTDEPSLPSPTPTEKAGRCGDGVCDEAELQEATLCPQDCASPAAPTAASTAEPAVTVTIALPEPTETPSPTATPMPEPKSTVAIPARRAVTLPSGELAFVGDPNTVNQEGQEAAEALRSNVALILDGSGSMGEDLPGAGKTKLAVAKEVLAEIVPQIPTELRSTLWVYAHRYPSEPKAASCKDIEQVFALGPVDADAYVTKIQSIRANGWTPIADSIVAAAGGLPPGDFNSIILVSDGEETCGGDPCAVAEVLKDSETELTVHVVGYAVDVATRQQLQCIARTSGGSYQDATDAEGLLQALEEALAAAVVETVLLVEIVDPEGEEVQEEVLLFAAGADRKQSYYRSWVDNVLPPGSYDLQVFTLPSIIYPELQLPEGSTTVVRIVQGSLSVVTPEGVLVAARYRDASTGTDLGFWGHEGPVVLVPGTYRVSINQSTSAPVVVQSGVAEQLVLGAILVRTLGGEPVAADFFDAATNERLGAYGHEGPALFVPGTYCARYNQSTTESIALEAGQTVTVDLGGVLVLSPDGEPVAAEYWDAGTDQRLGAFGYDGPALFVPGSYVAGVSGSYTAPIALESGQMVEVRLGGVRVDGSFTIWDTDGKRLGAHGDTLLLVPGTYTLELADGTVVEDVVVTAGEVTEVP